MKERNFKLVLIFAALSGVLLNYQNCGSQKNALDGSGDVASIREDGEMDIIDPMNIGGIQFVQTKATLTSQDTALTALGTCSDEQDGAILSWKVFDADGTQLLQGKSPCDHGTFQVVLDGVEELECGVELSLKAVLGSKAKTELSIAKNCN